MYFIILKNDGRIIAIRREDKTIERNINKSILELKKNMGPLVKYISKNIFNNTEILFQELVISGDKKWFALCDLSNQESFWEIKSCLFDINKEKYQLYYEANGRECYILSIDWNERKKKLIFVISKIEFKIKEKEDTEKKENTKNEVFNFDYV